MGTRRPLLQIGRNLALRIDYQYATQRYLDDETRRQRQLDDFTVARAIANHPVDLHRAGAVGPGWKPVGAGSAGRNVAAAE